MATRRRNGASDDLVQTFLHMQSQVKLFHWQTKSFAEHKATDELVSSLADHIDAFIETYMGKYGRVKVRGSSRPLQNYSPAALRSYVHRCTQYLAKTLPHKLNAAYDSDLLNIRDEILGDLNKTLYLFTLA